MKKNKTKILLYTLAIVNILVSFFVLKYPIAQMGDPVSYYNAMQFLKGEAFTPPIPLNRLLTVPLMLFTSIFFGFFIGNLYWSMAVINIIFYFLAIYFFYRIVLEIYNDEKVALLSSILFFSDYVIFTFGTALLTDMGGWFFFILSTFFAIKYYKSYKSGAIQKKFYFASIITASVGFLFKEYAALGLVSLVFLILVLNIEWKKRIKQILLAGALFIIIPLIYHLWFYLYYHYSYWDWYFYNYESYAYAPIRPELKYGFHLLIKVLGWLYLAGWPIFLFGLWQEKKYFDKERIKILAALLPASIMFLIWPSLNQRPMFILVPWLALISGFGLSKLKNNYMIGAFLAFYILMNYFLGYYLGPR